MDSVLCAKCNKPCPIYIGICEDCSSDFLEQKDERDLTKDVDLQIELPEESEISTIKQTGVVMFWICGTLFKTWFLYKLNSGTHTSFPQFFDIFYVVSPLVFAAISARAGKPWHQVLLVDSVGTFLIGALLMAYFG